MIFSTPSSEDRDEQGTDHAAEGVGDHTARILDDLGIAVLKAERCRKQLGQARIHAAQYRKLLLRILIGLELFVALLFNEGLVEIEDFFNSVHSCSFFNEFYRRFCAIFSVSRD